MNDAYDNAITDKEALAKYGPPAPEPGIAELLAAIEPWCEWLHGDQWGWAFTFYDNASRIEPDDITTKDQALLLGAICADCDARNWLLDIATHRDYVGKLWYRTRLFGPEDVPNYGRSWQSRLVAALRAFRDALRAAVCPECGEQTDMPFHTCSGTGKVRSDENAD